MKKYAQDEGYRKLRRTNNNPQLSQHGSTLATAWNFDDLEPSSLWSPQVLSMMNSDGIQEHFVFWDGKGSSSLNLLSEDDFEIGKEALLSSSVIKRNKNKKELSIHRIIAQEVRSQMPQKTFEDVLVLAAECIYLKWPFNDELEKRHVASRWQVFEGIFRHIEHLHELYSQSKPKLENKESILVLARPS
ncbi:hypothetical protein QQS21_011789 [Conoideocrella luteorostrata]|uniref:DUF7779 domain-containing protein n=1 Tax=Conoideocrella luteorostrata TaxID=1105319 RepID=A0AAJ0CDH1_9HYPO|nr:hypothetical protein QQS21_011789 [Conoideocrella luteorostrata]